MRVSSFERGVVVVLASALLTGLAWYVFHSIRGTIYFMPHRETSFPIWAAWYPGYSWFPVMLAAICGGVAACLFLLFRRSR